MASKRREACERGMEEEAERQGALAERNRNRMNELMTLGYERAMECLDESWVSSNLRASDVLQIIRLHMDAVKAFGVEEPRVDDDWTEEDAEFDEIIREVDTLTDLERPEKAMGGDPEEGPNEVPSEEREGEET